MSVRLVVAILLVAVVAVQSQIPIPSRYDGYAQGSPASPILFEMVGDLLCSDCLTTWPNIKSGLDYLPALSFMFAPPRSKCHCRSFHVTKIFSFNQKIPDPPFSFHHHPAVISYYNPAGQPSNLRFVFHVFPLPYHYNAYAAAQGAAIVKYLAPARIFDWIDAVYANQPSFYNEATADMTSNQVHAAFASLAAKSTGVDPSKVRRSAPYICLDS
jgi:hypothetical protein